MAKAMAANRQLFHLAKFSHYGIYRKPITLYVHCSNSGQKTASEQSGAVFVCHLKSP